MTSALRRAGEITAYVGPNGSGKSTTMKMITGLIEATAGEILFDGVRVSKDPIAYRARMGYVPEEPQLYSHRSGLEFLTMVTQLRDLPRRESSERIDGLRAWRAPTSGARPSSARWPLLRL